MISLKYSKIDSYLDNLPLTKQSRIEYYNECTKIIDLIKKLVALNYRTPSDVGAALKLFQFNKFKTNPLNPSYRQNSNSVGELKTFLQHLGYSYNSSSCIIRTLKAPLSIKGNEILIKLKDIQ